MQFNILLILLTGYNYQNIFCTEVGSYCNEDIISLESADVSGLTSIHPIGLKQCERKCLSDSNCMKMVFHVKELTCYFEKSSVSSSNSGNLGFVIKTKDELLNTWNHLFPCGGHQCSTGYTCIVLSSGTPICVAQFCISDPPTVSNAVATVQFYSILSSVTYSCNDGYYNAAGESSATCQSNLDWTIPTLVCCKDGFTYNSDTNMIYKVVTGRKYYNDALDYCSNLGAGIVRIDTNKKRDALSQYLSMDQYFTDATDLQVEGQWVYSDGTSVDMTMFYGNEPDGGTTENCGIYGYTTYFYDVRCNSNRAFICEIR